MADGRLYTIRDVARELGLPESTVRYYRNAYAAYLPSVGTGRRRRYPPEAIPLLRLVAEGYAQNRPRAEIEQALSESLSASSGGGPATAIAPAGFGGNTHRDELLATILDGERERREVMWQMARELVRLGEAIERQHVVLARLAQAATTPSHSLPATSAEGAGAAGEAGGAAAHPARPLDSPAAPPAPPPSPAPSTQQELEQLRQELARERELVERLRRSKLDIERRAAEAEAQLGGSSATPQRRGLLGRLLARDHERRR
jgi:DNA-binding transcriptional MerR regulator